MRKLFFLLLINFFYQSTLSAQNGTQYDVQAWINLTATGCFNKQNPDFNRFKYWLEGQERAGDDISRFSQSLARIGAGYVITPNLSLWAGYAFIHTTVPFTSHPSNEDRIWEQLLWVKKNTRSTLTSRTRLEQRFLVNADRVAYRVRELLKWSMPFQSHPMLSFVSSDEVFWHKNDFIGRNGRGFDQNRFFIGMGYQWNAQTVIEAGYLNQYIKRFGIPDFLNNAASITLLVNF